MDGIRGVIHMPFRRRRRRMRSNLYFRPMPRSQRVFLFFLIIALILSIVVVSALIRIRPIILSLATSEVYKVVMLDINNVIDEEMSSGSMDYSNLVKLEKDYGGNITALKMNMPMINLLQARISKGVVNRVENSIVTDIKIPVGNAFGGVIFSGRGPLLTVKILSVTSVSTQFINEYEPAGINQWHHKIMLDVSAVVDIYVPGTHQTQTIVNAEVEVADYTIFGEVPNVYADIGQGN